MVWIETPLACGVFDKRASEKLAGAAHRELLRERERERERENDFFFIPESNGTDGLNKLEGTTLLVLAIIISWSGKRPTDRLMPNYHKYRA